MILLNYRQLNWLINLVAMFNISLKVISSLVIAFGTVFAITYDIPLNTETRTTQSNTENWELREKTDWSFSSENESISIQDDLEELEEYSISEPNTETDLEISEENRRWGNRGDVENYSIEVEVYDY